MPSHVQPSGNTGFLVCTLQGNSNTCFLPALAWRLRVRPRYLQPATARLVHCNSNMHWICTRTSKLWHWGEITWSAALLTISFIAQWALECCFACSGAPAVFSGDFCEHGGRGMGTTQYGWRLRTPASTCDAGGSCVWAIGTHVIGD